MFGNRPEEGLFIQTANVSSAEQLAYLLKKPLVSSHHQLLSAKFRLISKVQLEGGIGTN